MENINILGYTLRSELTALEESLEAVRSELNNTGRAPNQELLIFNRVPKVGSQTILTLLNKLSWRNNFTAYKDDDQVVRQFGETTVVRKLN